MGLTSLKVVPVGEFSEAADHPATNDFKLVFDGDAKVDAEQTLSFVDAPEGLPVPGAKALKISYRMDAGWKFIRLAPLTAAVAKIEERRDFNPTQLGLWIHSDGVVAAARLRFADCTGQVFQ